MSVRSYSGPSPAYRPAPFGMGFAWALAIGTIALQIALPLVDDDQRPSVAAATVVVFFLASLVHATACHRWRGLVVVGLVIPLIGWAVERVGSTTGVPFGDYVYTDALGPQVMDVPAVIPLAWAMMAYPAHVAAATLTWRRWLIPVLTAWSLMAWDLFLDPLMVELGAWRWATTSPSIPGLDGIPLVNAAGWFAVGLVVGIVLLALPSARAPVAQPAVLFLWVYVSSVVGAAFFFDDSGAAVVGGIAMGIVAIPYLWRLWVDRI